MFRVPLVLEKSIAVIHRLNPVATDSLQPYAGATSGYDPDFKETLTYDTTRQGKTVRENARIELPPVRIPCQVEIVKFEDLRQTFSGDTPDSDISLVLHRMDLSRLKLLEDDNSPSIKVNDRLEKIESNRRPGQVIRPLEPPGLYVFAVRPGSWGFGPDGHDLHIVYLSDREQAQ
jgi:hypothetical protein